MMALGIKAKVKLKEINRPVGLLEFGKIIVFLFQKNRKSSN